MITSKLTLMRIRSTVHDDIQGTSFWPAPYDGRALVGESYKDHVSGLPIEDNIKKYGEANQSGDTSRLVSWAYGYPPLLQDILGIF